MKITRFRPAIYGLLHERGRVLVCETRIGNGASFTNFPGGGIELGEDPEAALLREFREETGLVVRAKRALYTSMTFHRGHVRPEQQLLGLYWEVERLSGTLNAKGNGDDVLRAFWATPKQLLSLPFTTFDREALPAIAARLLR